jgi:hypothetical protein
VPYLPRLGFYSDDWGLLAGFNAKQGQSLASLVGGFAGRPVQGVYLALLFKFFGLNSLGYHVVNAAVIAASACLLYLLLLRLRFGRVFSFATILLFLMLPQLSTVRVWYAAFQIPLSLALMLVSMHCQLSFARSGGRAWLIAAAVAAIFSIGAYEIFAPLLAGFAAMLGFEALRNPADRQSAFRTASAALLILCVVLLGVIYKLLFSGRVGALGAERYLQGLHQFFRLDYDWRTQSSLNFIATPRAYFWAPVRGWWTGAQTLIGGGAGLQVTAIAILIGGIAWWRLSVQDGVEQPAARKRLLLLGIATFLLGNATFLIVPAVVFTSTGMDNRVHVAAAIGVAMIFVSAIAYAASAAPQRHRQTLFCAAIALITAAAFARLTAIERYWAEAPALQERILTSARADLRNVPANSTIILDGICPYHGPAVVFEAGWDMRGALTLALGRAVAADVVSPRMTRTATGLATSIYKEPSFYPYGPRLYIYNPVKHLLFRLADVGAAQRYFATREPPACAPGFVARGVEV